ncbi:MAG: putative DNA-binding protein [Filifactoraceae bacterium]
MQIEKFLLISNLLSLYGPLLTEKQIDIMNYHYQEDLSLGEISEIVGISRQAVHDTIKRCEASLMDYEDKMGLWKKQEKYDCILKSIVEIIEGNSISNDVKNSLLKLCEELEQ